MLSGHNKQQSHDQTHSSNRKVVFNISSSAEGLHHYLSDSSLGHAPATATTSQNTSASDLTRGTRSTYVSDVSINIEDEKMRGVNGGRHYLEEIDEKNEDTLNCESRSLLKQETVLPSSLSLSLSLSLSVSLQVKESTLAY